MGREPSLKYYIECSVNGYESRPVPLSVFHRFPVDNNWISSKTPFMSKLSCCSDDSELFELISGKTVKVLDVVPGYEIDFEAPRKSDGSYSLRKSMFPIFEQVLGK